MASNELEAEKAFTASLISALSTREPPPSREEVQLKARDLAKLFDYTGPLESVVEDTLIAIDTRMGAGTSLVDFEAAHDEEWVFKREGIKWTYSDAYDSYLRSEGWSSNLVGSLSDIGTKILGHLQDPTSEGAWDRRGLVIGHVQSGKTANYMSVIAKAADAGYKFFIVIAGIHNNLRKQTQERIDAGFVGISSDPNRRVKIGVGELVGKYPFPATLTNINNDFNKATANTSGWRLNDFSKPIILVIKKNVSTLNALFNWLKELNAQGDGQISDVPMLMIDDEADNASINTRKEDLDPTKTNLMIRKVLGLFAKSCYVGYTATPFANIFINPDAYSDEAREELFPRDFIYCLDAPTQYFGPDKVFLNDELGDRIVKEIEDGENYLPFSHKKDFELSELPPSLYRALNQFIIAKAIRNLRGQSKKHCSMMINVSRFVDIQRAVRDRVSAYEKKLREAVKANYAMRESVAEKNEYMKSLKREFDSEYSDCEFSWPEVKSALYSAFENLRIFVVNSKSDEALDYKKYELDGNGLTAIAVGGLSLSRGLTIEGLTISYMYRNTRMYDTLMQMGRWFGYRPGFEDLCRVWLSPDSINWYAHIADASEELRQQIKRMRRDRLSPRQFGLYVMAHPDRLLITAVNKMRAGERVTVNQNFSGRLLESYVLPADTRINEHNRRLIEESWKTGFGEGRDKVVATSKGWMIRDVPSESIEEFIGQFRAHQSFVERKAAAASYLRAIADKHPVTDVLLISVSGEGQDESQYTLGPQMRESASKIGDVWRLSKDRVASRGDEKIGLTGPQREEAEQIAREADPEKGASDFHYRAVRKKPLLMVHSLDLGDKKSGASQTGVPAFGISFPPGMYTKEIEVVANVVWIDQMHGATLDSPDEDEDYDE